MPLLARIYPNGLADVNHFHAAGGMGFLIRELLDAGLLHEDVQTVWGEARGLCGRGEARRRRRGRLEREAAAEPATRRCWRPARGVPADGRLKVLSGNLGHAVIKTSAVKPERH